MNFTSLEFLKLSKEILAEGRSLRFQAKGWSMYPVIREGDILEIDPVSGEDVRLGDIIFYSRNNDRALIHRIIGKFCQNDKQVFLTKGDSQIGSAEEVRLESILGRLRFIERNKKKIDFNRRWISLGSVLLAKSASLIIKLRDVVARILSYIQGFSIYRRLARDLIKEEIRYDWQIEIGTAKTILAKVNQKTIGKITVKNCLYNIPSYRGWWIFNLWVNRAYRRLGIGSQLTEMACSYAKKNGASEVKAKIFKDDNRLVNFYVKSGFYQVFSEEISLALGRESKATGYAVMVVQKNLSPVIKKT